MSAPLLMSRSAMRCENNLPTVPGPDNSICDYLQSLRWDGLPRLSAWLYIYGNAADTAFVRAAGRAALVAAVRRARYPGCELSGLLILEGRRGDALAGLETLAPAWACFHRKRAIDARVPPGKWIVALDLKDVRDDTRAWREGWRTVSRLVVRGHGRSVPRDFVCIGHAPTTVHFRNWGDLGVFWPVPIGRFDLDALEAARDQLWAEAVVAEALGESIALPQELWVVPRGTPSLRLIDGGRA